MIYVNFSQTNVQSQMHAIVRYVNTLARTHSSFPYQYLFTPPNLECALHSNTAKNDKISMIKNRRQEKPNNDHHKEQLTVVSFAGRMFMWLNHTHHNLSPVKSICETIFTSGFLNETFENLCTVAVCAPTYPNYA